MKLKTVEVNGAVYAAVVDGKPLYVDDAGKEVAFDVEHATGTIRRLNAEAKSHREAKEAAEATAKAFEGMDPKAVRKALDTVAGLDAKALIDAGKADEMRAAAIKAVEEQYRPFKEQAEKLEAQLRQERIGGSFARSKFIAEKLVAPVPMVEATFARHFSLEDGKVIARDANGNQIYSSARPGEPADFEEALESLVNASPFRDSILKGRNQSGTGAPGGTGGPAGGGQTITRSDFDRLNKTDPAAAMKMITADGVTVVD